ncbi:hypothetical protein [Variovorax sp. GB1P17]|uniref:hypothetical protein n=1 Tax=Variovorax sp. GB1P17 TaxID=3443740 RepID=UPI003F499FB3
MALFRTIAPLRIVMFALSPRLIAFAFPTATCALGPTVTIDPDGVVGPMPMVEVQGLGAVVSQFVVSPDTVHAA